MPDLSLRGRFATPSAPGVARSTIASPFTFARPSTLVGVAVNPIGAFTAPLCPVDTAGSGSAEGGGKLMWSSPGADLPLALPALSRECDTMDAAGLTMPGEGTEFIANWGAGEGREGKSSATSISVTSRS